MNDPRPLGVFDSGIGGLTVVREHMRQLPKEELVYFGDTINADEAYRIGHANRVVPADQLMDEAHKWAQRLKDGPQYALGVTKELLEHEANVNLETALEMEAMAQARCMETPDFIEGYNGFIEKRPLRFNRS